jgi:hypothetical protein
LAVLVVVKTVLVKTVTVLTEMRLVAQDLQVVLVGHQLSTQGVEMDRTEPHLLGLALVVEVVT